MSEFPNLNHERIDDVIVFNALEKEDINLIIEIELKKLYARIKDLGYEGNMANVWDGVPEEVLKEHDVAYDPEWLAKCVDQSKRDVIAEWDEEGNLVS